MGKRKVTYLFHKRFRLHSVEGEIPFEGLQLVIGSERVRLRSFSRLQRFLGDRKEA
jgi:hypothetical protein